MHVKKPLVVVIATTFLMLWVFDSPGFAHNTGRSHRHNSRKYRSSGRGRSSPSAAAKAYADMMRAAAIRAAAVRAAHAEVSRAHAALRSSRTLQQREFELSPQMSSAVREHADTRRDYDRARQAVFDRLAKDRDYQNAKRVKQELHNRGQALKKSGRGTQEQLVVLLKQEAQAGAIVTKKEAAAINDDAAARRARDRVQSAAARVRDLKRGFERSVTQDPRWSAARNNLEAARRKLAQAYSAGNKALASASRSRSSQRYPSRR